MVGIYVIKSEKHFYIGLSSELEKRKQTHFYKLKNNIHSNLKLQNVYNKGYNLEFEIIQECSIEDLDRLEILWMDLYQVLHPELKMLNLKSGGNRPEYSYESKEKISKSKCKKQYDFKQRYNILDANSEEFLGTGTLLELGKIFNININQLEGTLIHKNTVRKYSLIESLDEPVDRDEIDLLCDFLI